MKRLSQVAAVLCMLATVGGLVAYSRRTGPVSDEKAPADVRPAERESFPTGELRTQITAMDADLKSTREALVESDRELIAARREIADLRRQVEELQKYPIQLPPLKLVTNEPLTAEQIGEFQKQAMDRNLDAATRVEALLQLRTRTSDGRTPEVVRSIIELLESCGDARVRANICRHSKGVDFPEAKEAFIRRLREDKDAKVREEAAEALVTWKEDARVQAELQAAASGDEDERVRDQAQDSLRGRR